MKRNLLKIGVVFVALLLLTTNKLFAFTAVTSGAWSNAATWGGVAPGTSVTGQDIIIPAGISVLLDTDVNFSGLLNTFSVDGTLSSITTNKIALVQGSLSGNGSIGIHRFSFGALSSSTYTGAFILDILENSGALVSFASVATVADSLTLEAGTLTLTSGANLELLNDCVIKRNNGSIILSGGIFALSNLYNVLYVGSSKTSGIELNSLTLQNVYLQLTDNSQTITLGSDLVVTSILNMSTGHLAINGHELELLGDLIINPGALLESNATSSITLESALPITSGFIFSVGSSVEEFTIEYTGTGTVQINSSLEVLDELNLIAGKLSLETGSTLVMATGSLIHVEDGGISGNGGSFDGSLSYDLEYMGSTVITGLEFSGTGLNDVTINMLTPEDEIHMGGNIEVNGHLNLIKGWFHFEGYDVILNGTISQGPDALIKGDQFSELELNLTMLTNDTLYFKVEYPTIEKLTVNLTGPGHIVLGSSLTIENDLVFTNGKIEIFEGDLTVKLSGVITGYDDTKYVITSGNGRLKRYVNFGISYYVFPIGDVINYSPASIHEGDGGSFGYTSVSVSSGVSQYGPNGGQNVALSESVVNKTWKVESDSTHVREMDLKLGWLVASEVNGFDRADSYISQYMAPWDTYTASAAIPGLNNTYEIERIGITILGSFTVTDNSSSLSVDAESDLLTVTLFPNPCADILNLNYNSNNQFVYQITDMSGRSFDVVNDGSNQFDVSFLTSGIYMLRIIDLNTNEVIIREFVKM